MFGLGFTELAIIGVLGWFAFRHIIARRFPGFYRALDVIFLSAVGLMLVFGLLARLRH